MSKVYHARQLSLFPEKQCPQCQRTLPATPEYFYRDKTQRDGLKTLCQECYFKRTYKRDKPEANPTTKQCSRCMKWLDATPDYFPRDGSRLRTNCKECDKLRKKRRRSKPAEPVEYKQCAKCQKSFEASFANFAYSTFTPDRRKPNCRQCQKEIRERGSQRVTYPDLPQATLVCYACGRSFQRKQFTPYYESKRRTKRVYCPDHSPSKVKRINPELIADSYLQGQSMEIIGERFHCATTTIRYYLRQMGVRIRTSGARFPQVSGKPPRVSRLEDRVAKELELRDIAFTRQYGVSARGTKGYIGCLDFLLADGRGIEVNGTFWHADPREYPDGPIYASQKLTLDHYNVKMTKLAKLGIRVIELWEMDLEADFTGAIDRALAI